MFGFLLIFKALHSPCGRHPGMHSHILPTGSAALPGAADLSGSLWPVASQQCYRDRQVDETLEPPACSPGLSVGTMEEGPVHTSPW